MQTLPDGTTKQSPSPQHNSPAALRCPPRWIQLSWAEAGEMRNCERISETSSDRAKHRNMTAPFVVPARKRSAAQRNSLVSQFVWLRLRNRRRDSAALRDTTSDSTPCAHNIIRILVRCNNYHIA